MTTPDIIGGRPIGEKEPLDPSVPSAPPNQLGGDRSEPEVPFAEQFRNSPEDQRRIDLVKQGGTVIGQQDPDFFLGGIDRQMAAAVLTEYDPSLMGNDVAMQNALRALDTVWSPELKELMFNAGDVGVTKAMAMTDKEYAAAKILETGFGGESTASSIVAGGMRSMILAREERAARLWRPGNVWNDESVVSNEFDAAQLEPEDIAKTVDISKYDTFNVLGKSVEGLTAFLNSGELREATTRDGVWKLKGDTLIFAFTDDSGQLFSGVRLDEGTTITTTAQAIGALIDAKSGKRHVLVGDEAEGARIATGIALKFVGDTARFLELKGKAVGDTVLPAGWRPEVDYTSDAERGAELAQERLESGGATNEVFAALSASDAASDLSVAQIYAAAEQITADGAFVEDYTKMSADQIVEAARLQDEEEGTAVDWFTETALPPVVDLLEGYDKAIQAAGITVLAVAKGGFNMIDDDAMTTFQSAFDEARESTYVSEMFGIDPSSGWGQSINLAGSIILDPITWFTPGAKATLGWMDEMVTNPALTRKLLTTPQVRSGVSQLVKGRDPRIVLSLFADGMSDDALEFLLDVSVTKYARGDRQAIAESVYKTLARELPANGGSWTMANARTMVHAKNVMGFGTVIRDVSKAVSSGKPLKPGQTRTLDRWASIWARASKDRSFSLSDDFVQRALEYSVWRHPDDMTKVIDDVQSALKVKRAMESGTVDEIAVAKINRQTAIDELKAARRVITTDTDLRRFNSRKVHRDDLHEHMLKSDAAGGKMPEGFDELLADANSYVDANKSAFDEAQAVIAEKRAAMREADATLKRLSDPKERALAADWVDNFFDEWADEIGVPRIENAEGKLVPDWDEVSGGRTPPIDQPEDVTWFIGYSGPIDSLDRNLTVAEREARKKNKLIADQARDVGMNPQRTVRVTPVSPIEMLGYQHATKAYRAAMRNFPKTTDAVSATLDGVQNIFAANVLLSPKISVKSALDEPIRMFETAGFAGGKTLPQQAGALPIIEHAGLGRRNLSNRAAQALRDGAGSPSVSVRTRAWEVVSPRKDPGAAERFVNGTMLNMEDGRLGVQKYAQARISGDRTEFARWWNEEGVRLYQGVGKKGKLTADEAYQYFDNIMNHFFSRGDDALPKSTVDEVLRAASEGNKANLSKKAWAEFPDMPGQVKEHGKGIDWSFDQLYGRPSDARGSLIFEHYYQWKRGILNKSTKEGQVIGNVTGTGEAQRLVNAGVADDLAEAGEMLARGRKHPKVKSLLSQGWRLESDIDAAAASYAKAQSDSMMYTMGAVSVGGKRLARLFPWGRAQFDYMNWWSKKLFEPTQVRVPGAGRIPGRVGREHPRGVFTPSTSAGGRLPELNRVNIRLIDRFAKIVNLNPDREGDAPPGSPQWFVDEFSFLPTELSSSFIIENTPSMGPIPSWLVNFLPSEGDSPGALTRRAVENAVPSHQIFNDYDNDSVLGSILHAFSAVAPSNSRTLMGLFTDQIIRRGIAGFGDSRSAILNTMYELFEPPNYRDHLVVEMFDFLDSGDVFKPENVFGGSNTQEMLTGFADNARRNANNRKANESFKAYVGAPSYLGAEAQSAAAVLPMIDMLPQFVADGILTQGSADNLRIAAEQVDAGLKGLEAIGSHDDLLARKRLTDAGQDILFSGMSNETRTRFIIDNPAIAVNMVRWVEAVDELVPDEYKEFVFNGKIEAPSSVIDEIYTAGFKDDWIVARPTEEVMQDIVAVTYRAASSRLRMLWEDNVPFSFTTRDKEKLALTAGVDAETVKEIEGVFDTLYVDVPEEWANPDGTWSFTLTDFQEVLRDARDRFVPNFGINTDVERVLSASDSGGALLMSDMDQAAKLFRDLGYDSPLDAVSGPEFDEAWAGYVEGRPSRDGRSIVDDHPGALLPGGTPEQLRELIRERHREEVTINTNYSSAMYGSEYERDWGPLGYEAFRPPAVKDLEVPFTAPANRWMVVDGDTIEMVNDAGEVIPFRLLGINAPDDGDEGYGESTEALQSMIRRAKSVTVGMFNRAKYGDTQQFYTQTADGVTDRVRIFGVLYVDMGDGNGPIAVFNPEEFTEKNERGAPQGRTLSVPEYEKYRLRELGGGI